MKGVDEAIDQARAFERGSSAIKIDQKAPGFELPNFDGKLISLDALQKKGPLIVTFYRGGWCPYFNLQLRALQARLEDILAIGASLVAISLQAPDGSMSSDDMSELDFMVLSDQDAKIASQYGVAWKVPESLVEHMRVDRKLNLEEINNGYGSVLPIPATFVLDRDGVVTWRYVDVDYRTRSEPDDIIEALQKLS